MDDDVSSASFKITFFFSILLTHSQRMMQLWMHVCFQIMKTNFADKSKSLDQSFKSSVVRGFKPISRSFFAVPASNASEQFIYFVSLVSWLLSVNNQQVKGWNKYDDPMTASQNVMIELKNLGLNLDIAPNKLKTGYGEEVCQVLLKLT